MKFKGSTINKSISLVIYYTFAQYLPMSGKLWNLGGCVRYYLCKRIIKSCGAGVNIERRFYLGNGSEIMIGDYSGEGMNAVIPPTTHIGNNVMMAPICYILD